MAMTSTTTNAKSHAPSNGKNVSTPLQQKVMKKDEKHQRNSPPKVRTPSPKAVQKLSHSSTSDTHFCSSVFFNSPDPSSLPMPIFDDDETVVNSKKSTKAFSVVNKTDTLRQFLNVCPSISTQIAV